MRPSRGSPDKVTQAYMRMMNPKKINVEMDEMEVGDSKAYTSRNNRTKVIRQKTEGKVCTRMKRGCRGKTTSIIMLGDIQVVLRKSAKYKDLRKALTRKIYKKLFDEIELLVNHKGDASKYVEDLKHKHGGPRYWNLRADDLKHMEGRKFSKLADTVKETRDSQGKRIHFSSCACMLE